MKWAQKQKGFTIVELLIVVVVIAILAAITIVSYNGIQNRAKASTVQENASQAARKIASAAVLDSDLFPDSASLRTATGLSASVDGSTPFQYSVSQDRKDFCLTATNNGLSYYVSNTKPTPTAGACPGHGNGGVATVSNLVVNPSVESGSNGWSLHTALTPTGGSPGRTQVGGKWVMQGTRNASNPTAIYISQSLPSDVTPDTVYTASVLATSSVAQTLTLQVRPAGSNSPIFANAVAIAANTPTRIYAQGSVGSTSSVYLTLYSGSGTSGDVITADEAMLTLGITVYGSYMDGSTPNWIWTGTTNASVSTGPPL